MVPSQGTFPAIWVKGQPSVDVRIEQGQLVSKDSVLFMLKLFKKLCFSANVGMSKIVTHF